MEKPKRQPQEQDIAQIKEYLAQYGIIDPIIISRYATINMSGDWQNATRYIAGAMMCNDVFIHVVLAAIGMALTALKEKQDDADDSADNIPPYFQNFGNN